MGEGGATGARGGRLRQGQPAARWEKGEPVVVGEGAGSGGRRPQKGRRVSKVGEEGACGGKGGRLRRPPAVRWERGQSVVEEGAIYEMPVHTWCIHLVQFHSHCYQLPLRYIPASFE